MPDFSYPAPPAPDAPPSFLDKPEPAAVEPEPYPLERSGLQLYLQEIAKTPLLTIAEEVALARRIRRGDRAARDHMIKANLRLVVKIAHDYKDFGLPLLDLISEGNIGLIKAIVRFDPRKGGKLSTYAAWWIKQCMKRALANQSKTIRLPVHLIGKISKMRQAAVKLAEELGREPTDEEVAIELNIPTHKVAHLKSVSIRPTSLDAPIGGEGESATFGEIVRDENALSPYENIREGNLKSDLNRMINSLDRREADILRMRFGLDGHEEQTLDEVGKKFKVTRERVRQLQVLAVKKIRELMARNEAQRSTEEIEQDERLRKRMEVLRAFFESKAGRRPVDYYGVGDADSPASLSASAGVMVKPGAIARVARSARNQRPQAT
ncbi:MAG TPA: RNA polymerase sigma factor RpoD/SigA [Opitutaceae bacterium]|nr:RNA polymerase sigma factor RpoD/SigA [Opitutaceae bacterium]